MTKILLLPIETSIRELDYKLLLSIKLLKNNGRVFIGSKGHLSIFMKYFTNFNYLDKGYHLGTSDKIYASINNLGGHIFSLDEEGAVDFQDNSSLSLRYSAGAFDGVKRVYFWGEEQKSKYSLDESKSLVTGHPRFELLGSRIKKIYLKESEKLSKKYGNFVLVNTNMSIGNNIRGNDFVIKNYKSRFPGIEELIYQDNKKIEEICKAIQKLLAKNYNVILRPHPEEDLRIYKEFFLNHSKLFINKTGSVIPWIMASDFVLHTDCTTAIEAIWLDKHCISIMPDYKNKDYFCPLPISLSFSSTSDDLIDDIQDFLAMPIKDKLKVDLLEQYFSFSHGSLEILSDDLIKNANSKGNINTFRVLMKSIRLRLTSLLKIKEDKLISTKLKGLNRENIIQKLNLVSDALEINEEYSVVKLSKYFYEIRLK